jgi:hypothetical protein
MVGVSAISLLSKRVGDGVPFYYIASSKGLGFSVADRPEEKNHNASD